MVPGDRVRACNQARVDPTRRYVLYWSQIYRRLSHNHALDHALRLAVELKKPLVVYEGLKLGYPWASVRLHRFILEGMAANVAEARRLGINYWPFVETPSDTGRGLLRRLAADACAVVTDDFPCFIIPDHTAALAAHASAPVIAVDGNGIVPLSQLGAPVAAAAHLRPRIHRAFAAAWTLRAAAQPDFPKVVRRRVEPPFPPWKADDLDAFIDSLPLDRNVPPVIGRPGGFAAARQRLNWFVERRLKGYAENRSQPKSLDDANASGLSPYLHFGHVSIEEVVAAVLSHIDWTPDQVNAANTGKREGFYCTDADVNSFLDEAITWRDVGFQWHWTRRQDTASLDRALPAWALATLRKHAADRRQHLYTLEEFEAAATHDELWNAAQRELVAVGSIHNYLRMLWGKKIIEWSRTPDEAYHIMVHLNNKYGLDGRNPNSYTGILWCFGLFDRPWAPERPVFGTVRWMSSDNTAKKFKLDAYMRYVASLPELGMSGQSTGRDSSSNR